MTRTDPAVVEALSRAHATLLEDLQKLEEAVRQTPKEGFAAVRARLGDTQTHLTEHFRFEEDNGYMETVRSREPRLERVLRQLAEEHRQLLQSLAALIEQARAAPNLDDTLRGEVRKWVESVRQHEFRENNLVQDAFTLDIGAED
jgi:hypothetical protein